MRIWLQSLALLGTGLIAVPIFGVFFETGYLFISLGNDSISQEIQANLKHFFDFLFLRFFQNSFWVLSLVLLLSSLIGITCAYLVAHFDFFFSNALEKILFLPLAIPAYILAFVYVGVMDYGGIFYEIFGFKLDFFNLFGVVFVLSISLFPYIYLFAKNSFQSESIQLYEVAKSMHYTQWQIFYKVSLVSARPAILGGALLVMMETLSDYGASAYLGIDTFSAGIFKLWYDLNDPYSSSILTALLMFFILGVMLLEKKLKGQKRYSFNQNTQNLFKREKLPIFSSSLACLYCFLIASLGFFIPLFWLLYWGLQDPKLLDPSFHTLILNSLQVGIFSSIFTLLTALFLCFVARITLFPFLSNFIKITSSLGYAIPGAVVGVSIMIFVSIISPANLLITNPMSILIFAYVARFLATAISSIQNGYDKIHDSIDEASLSLRPSYFWLWYKIHFPLLKHFILSASLIVFVDTIKELPITRMLAPFSFETLSLKAFWYATDERLYNSALPSLFIVLLSLTGMLCVHQLTRKNNA